MFEKFLKKDVLKQKILIAGRSGYQLKEIWIVLD
jgi:hypothetical protein